MKVLRLHRDVPSDIATEGVLTFGDTKLFTIERPWIPTYPGGEPFESCIPAGAYDIIHHERPNGDEVLALINPGLAVFYTDDDRINDVGRYLILIHSANWADQVNGCIAPGHARSVTDRGPMVTRSRDAMRKVMSYDPERIIITEYAE